MLHSNKVKTLDIEPELEKTKAELQNNTGLINTHISSHGLCLVLFAG